MTITKRTASWSLVPAAIAAIGLIGACGKGILLPADVADDLEEAWTPKDISGLILWLDAGSITGLTDGDDVVHLSELGGERLLAGSGFLFSGRLSRRPSSTELTDRLARDSIFVDWGAV